MSETQTNDAGGTVAEQAVDYSAIAAQAYVRAEASHHEGGSSGANDFDLAYSFASKQIAEEGLELDSNALFLALTAEKQNRIKAAQDSQ